MKRILSFLLFSFPFFLQSQSLPALTDYSQLETGKTYTLLGDDVNARAAAGTQHDVVAKIPIGSSLKLLEIGPLLKLKGFEAPWIQVEFDHHGDPERGYIWAGFLAAGSIQSKTDPELFFHYGASKVERVEWGDKVRMQIRAEKNNEEIAKVEFEFGGTAKTTVNSENLGDKGVKGVKDILNISYSDEYCGGAFGDVMTFWDGKDLHFAIDLRDGADAPMFADESLVFPADSAGLPGKLQWISVVGEYTDDGVEEVDQREEKIYVWNGKALEEVKKK